MQLNSKLLIRGMDGRDFDLEIMSYSSGLSQSPVQAQHQQPTSEANFQDFNIVHPMGRHSPRLARACAQGITIEQATLELSDGEGRRVMEYRLSDCLVRYFQAVGQTGDSYGSPTEQFSLSYGKIEWVYVDPETGEEFAERVMVSQPAAAPSLPSDQSRPFVPNTAFIVMWMDPDRPELDDVCHAIKDVCRLFGVTAIRADDIEHSEQITELVLSRIASSEFVIADMTGERPNVYYEIGYAQAIGKRPILIRRQDTHIHFDLSVHNIRAYKNLTQLKDLLSKRFEAIMGRSVSSDGL